ncbi:hypothetical protein PBCVNY2B_074R [Paramecium bursaria Chlorella virus NY2B]|uniref:Uncharacterized protein B061R n=1 Tax=Paramecium bursaria Chlorella virus NY2A TaxID=46021 RepID=A7IVT6_PBCVN|nr:hypothetical protein NY2A_B061R [Paramecium bursaria Chlorella virus NY2A]ABT14460.1 hypothetical protein NY2A_B061R [Paramecium bursaria Chlorella virus NY2A]AGE58213.1 hypothetical protein PBCVNY2B_074R [Paramecium bursaria Chlorella virus NY2B]
MDLDEFARFWKQDLSFEQKAKLYYEKIDHIIDDKGGYRPILIGEYRKDTLRYFKDDGEFEIFDDYTIDTNRNIERKDGTRSPKPRILNGYLSVNIRKNRKIYTRSIARAMLSTFFGPPPDLSFTADHIISERKLDDDLSNLRWLDESGQNNNRHMPETHKDARIIVNELFPGDEFTAKEWVGLYTKPDGTKYHENNFTRWAREKKKEFSYKTYDDIDEEEWKIVGDPDKNHVEVSNKNRVKDVIMMSSGREEHVSTSEQLCLTGGYPSKQIDGESYLLHILVFQLWYPDEWKNKKKNEMVLHKEDDRLDFRPENLRLGTRKTNGKDAHDNGKYDGKKTARQSCVAYDGDIIVNEFDSIIEAARYLLKYNDNLTIDVARSGIRRARKKEKDYKGFTWKCV